MHEIVRASGTARVGAALRRAMARAGYPAVLDATVKRANLGVLLAVVVILIVACLNEPTVKLTFVNESGFELCDHVSRENVARDDLCAGIKARGTTVWRPQCGAAGKQPLTVVLSVRGGKPEIIYDRTATCDEWEASGGKIVIEQREGEFVVTDGLSKPTRGP